MLTTPSQNQASAPWEAVTSSAGGLAVCCPWLCCCCVASLWFSQSLCVAWLGFGNCEGTKKDCCDGWTGNANCKGTSVARQNHSKRHGPRIDPILPRGARRRGTGGLSYDHGECMGRGQGHRAVPICRSGVSRGPWRCGAGGGRVPFGSPRPEVWCARTNQKTEEQNKNREPVEPGPVVVASTVWQ